MDAVEVFDGLRIDIPDLRKPYPEPRIATVGFLRGRMVIVVWTPDGDDGRRVIFDEEGQ